MRLLAPCSAAFIGLLLQGAGCGGEGDGYLTVGHEHNTGGGGGGGAGCVCPASIPNYCGSNGSTCLCCVNGASCGTGIDSSGNTFYICQ
jgi:hypothetical protein